MKRRDKINYYLDMADVALERGTCMRRNFGAIIVNNDEIVSTGYAGAPRGRSNCSDINTCVRDKLNIPRGERYEMCRSVHAETNAIISAKRCDMLGGTLYLAGRDAKTGELIPDSAPCAMCKRIIINAGIKLVIIRNTMNDYTSINVSNWIDNDESLNGTSGY
ncbi:MAG: deaminase [Oscillospiraceae bacterium]|nr:deaminase [Oscillospiraceae bacterium]